MFLITGCGRSGTKYMARVLNQAGLDVGHECAGKDGAVSSCWAALHGPYPSYHQQDRPEFDLVLHQVRDPLDTIGSILTSSEESWRFNERVLSLPRDMELLHKSMLYWILWNQLAERTATYTYRIEELDVAWKTLSYILDIKTGYEEATAGIPKDLNRRDHPLVPMSSLPLGRHAQLRRLARKYGYDY